MKNTSSKSTTKSNKKPFGKSPKKTSKPTLVKKSAKKSASGKKQTPTKKPHVAKFKSKSAVKVPLDLTDALIDMALDNTDGNCSHDAAFDLFYAATTLMHFSDASTEMLENMLETVRDIWFDYQSDSHNPDICDDCIAERKAAQQLNGSTTISDSNGSSQSKTSPTLSDAMRNKLN